MHLIPEFNLSSRARSSAARAAFIALSMSWSLQAQCVPGWGGLKHGAGWQALGFGVARGLNPTEPNGTLMTGGGFLGLAGQWPQRIAFCDGESFANPYGRPPLNSSVNAAGPAAPGEPGGIIAGFFYPSFAGVELPTVVRVESDGFHAIGDGPKGAVAYAARWHRPSGPPTRLYLGGRLHLVTPGGVGAVSWDGAFWQELPSPNLSWLPGGIYDLATFDDDGPGPRSEALYAGGSFGDNPGDPIRKIGRWDGKSWEAVGSPLIRFGTVDALAVYDDDGPGPHPESLYVGGYYRINGTTLSDPLMRLDEQQHWVRPGERLNSTVNAMAVFDADGPGPERESLFVGGLFTHAGQMPVHGIARWDGQQWHALGEPGAVGVTGFGQGTGVDALGVFDEDGPGPNPGGLYVGGLFYYAGTEYSWHVARWGCPQAPERRPCFPDCDNDGALTLADFGCFTTNHVFKTPYADCNADGHWDLADFQCFQTQYALGCP
ncbi:MAG: hypothetical protein IT437_03610 [Phycisphaerales bacterium]|nr:hypothetical protein [Phycisphaerales bacterium]